MQVGIHFYNKESFLSEEYDKGKLNLNHVLLSLLLIISTLRAFFDVITARENLSFASGNTQTIVTRLFSASCSYCSACFCIELSKFIVI